MQRLVIAVIMITLMAQIAGAEGAFSVGDRVWTTSDINLKVRDNPGISSNVIDSVYKGTLGTINDGPVNRDNYNWWKIDYDIGVTGWSAENWLEISPTSLPQAPDDFSQWGEQAIEWGEKRKDWNDWNGLCMRFVVDAFAQKDGLPAGLNADGWAKKLYRFNQGPEGWLQAPKGAVIFFDSDKEPVNGKLNTHGHVGIYLGEGKLIHAYGKVNETTIDEAIAKAGVGKYIGWSYPPESWRPNANAEGSTALSPTSTEQRTNSAESQSSISDDRAMGIDVSDYQGTIDWSSVAASGYKFAFVKATEGEGWTGDSEAKQQNFESNIAGASSAGMLAGAYHFARPDLGNNATDEARWFVNVAGGYIKPGYLRPVLDIEKSAGESEADLSKWINEWIDTVKRETGVEPMIYTSASFAADNGLDASLAKYSLWVAHWTYDTARSPATGFWDGWDFWQYSNKGEVPGINGDVDLDLFIGSSEELSNFIITEVSLMPIVQAFQVRPQSLNLGESVAIDYTVSDTGGSGLAQVELWRMNETSDWQQVSTNPLAGETGSVSGKFTDSPTAPGKYWYGVHVVDNAGNWNDQKNSNKGNTSVSCKPVEVIVKEPKLIETYSDARISQTNPESEEDYSKENSSNGNLTYLSDIGAYHIEKACYECMDYSSLCDPCIKYNAAAHLEVDTIKYDKGIKLKGTALDEFLADFHLSRKYSHLTGLAGLDDETYSGIDKNIKIIFEGDGKELYTTEVGIGDHPVDVDVDVRDIYSLRIRIINDNNYHATVDLLDMILSK